MIIITPAIPLPLLTFRVHFTSHSQQIMECSYKSNKLTSPCYNLLLISDININSCQLEHIHTVCGGQVEKRNFWRSHLIILWPIVVFG